MEMFLLVCVAHANVPRVYRAQGDDITMLRACMGSRIARPTRALGDDIPRPRVIRRGTVRTPTGWSGQLGFDCSDLPLPMFHS